MNSRGFLSLLLLVLLILGLILTVIVFKGGYGLEKKVGCLIALIVVSYFLLLNLTSLVTDIMMVARVIRGRKICVDSSGEKVLIMAIVDKLKEYLSRRGAVIVDDPARAEFQVTLSPDLKDPTAIICRLSDQQQGHTISVKEHDLYWPEPFVLTVANFIRREGKSRHHRAHHQAE